MDKFTICLGTNYINEVTQTILDVYYNKLSIPTFFFKIIELRGKYLSKLNQCWESVQGPNLYLSTPLSKLGYTLLYSTNCSKDLGPTLIILDSVLSNIENIKTIDDLTTSSLAYDRYLRNKFVIKLSFHANEILR